MTSQAISARFLRSALGRLDAFGPTQADWTQWAALAIDQRAIPLLYHVVDLGKNDLSVEQLNMATEMQVDTMAAMVRFEHDLLEVAAALDNAECRFAVLKGAATAHLDYSDPSMRQFADVDLLVLPQELSRACATLACLGWEQSYPLPRHHEDFTHAITLNNSRRVEVDLHQRIAHRAIGQMIPTRDLLADVVQFDVAGHALSALSRTDRLIHAALHAGMSRGLYKRLSSTADVLVLSELSATNGEAILARAESWGLRSLVERAIAESYFAAELPVNPAWVSAFSSLRHRSNWLVDLAYLSSERRPVAEELAMLYVMNGWVNRWRYVRGYFATDADYATRKHRSGLIAQSRYLISRLRAK